MIRFLAAGIGLVVVCSGWAADVVPTEVQMPGTQPLEVGALESPDRCNNCHSGYNDAATAAAGIGEPQDEPSTGWMGGIMAHATRDPIFWATVAVAEQDFDGSGDLCLRCHTPSGWIGGRSTPTDGSALTAADNTGVDCDSCHTMTNPDDSEHLGVMNSPFLANCSADPLVPDKHCQSAGEGFYGSGMLSLWPGSDKLGPYADADARHQWLQSRFHRDVDFCGSCHDVSNPVVGDLAPGNGALPGAPHVVSSQDAHGGLPNLGGPVSEKAAFNNPPYAYGVVERTFSEYKASAWPTTRVSDFPSLPQALRVDHGSPTRTWEAALVAGTGGDYADGDPRFFSCQSCHMRPVTSAGANKNGLPIRPDLPRHDHMGGNYWLVDIMRYQDQQGLLLQPDGLDAAAFAALEQGRQRAMDHLRQAASLEVTGNTLRVVNLTGHKLITGYPEGRRMWLDVKWFDAAGALVREDGAYGPLFDPVGQPVRVVNPANGALVQVESILDLESPYLRIYQTHYAITRDWAARLVGAGFPPDLVLDYDRLDHSEGVTLGELAAAAPGSQVETFHFVLNNLVASDTRIPPWGMRYDDARLRNTLPVPATQYGNPGPGGTFRYWDEVDLAAMRPATAVSARIDLLYQGTSWEYVQFLDLASADNEGFLDDEGENLLAAWINAEVPVAEMAGGDRRMVPPFRMATALWSAESFSVGGSVSGLQGNGLVLRNNGTDDLAITANGAFEFALELANGSPYAVTVRTQPTAPAQTCSVADGTGTITGADVTGVKITCNTNTYSVGGTVSGLQGSGMVLTLNGAGDLPIAINGPFAFPMELADGSTWTVAIKSPPNNPTQACTVSNGSGTLAGADVTNVQVTCASQSYTVGGTVSGLQGSGLVLRNNGGDDLAIAASGAFTFATPLADGSGYTVTVKTQPANPAQTCTVSNGSGTVAGADVTNVNVSCVTTVQNYSVGGSVSGLQGSGLVLRNNGGDDLAISANGAFTFSTKLANGSPYNVTVKTQPGNPAQTCTVANGSGSVNGANVTSVAVTCTTVVQTYSVGGTVSGLQGSGLVLRNNGGDDLAVSANGAFTFSTKLANGSPYNVTVKTQPGNPAQTCTVSNGSGSINGANVTNVAITCPAPEWNDELRNISTRMRVGTGNEVAIAGFIIVGDLPKCVVVRGRGPSVGVDPATRLPDPVLTLRNFPAGVSVAANDDWQEQSIPDHVAIISGLGLAPAHALDAAIYACLSPGAYTATLAGVNGQTGVGIVEVFDADTGRPWLSNISTRMRVGTGNDVAIAGFIITGTRSKSILVRGRGPSVGVDPAIRLADPMLTLKNFPQGATLAVNDDWADAANAADIVASGKAPAHASDAAILVELPPGAYTAILQGVGGVTGVGILELFDLTGR